MMRMPDRLLWGKTVIRCVIAVAALAAPSLAIGQSPDRPATAAEQELLEELRALKLRVNQLEERLQRPAAMPPAVAPQPPAKLDVQAMAAAEKRTPPPADIPLCDLNQKSRRDLIFNANEYTEKCLTMNRWASFDTLDLAVELLGSENGGNVEIVPSYTFRWGPPLEEAASGSYRTKYLKARGGVGARVDPGGKKSATFANLTRFETPSGLTGIFGLEFGFSRPVQYSKMASNVGKALAKARQECLAFHGKTPATDPFMSETPTQSLVLRRESDLLALCDGKALNFWMAENSRNGEYYRNVVLPIWGVKSDPYYFAGIEGRYSESTYKFFPLRDPASTGIPLITELPANFPDGDQEFKDKNLYSFRAYVGRGIGEQRIGGSDGFPFLKGADLSGSLTYRRDFIYPKGTFEQQLCKPGGTTILCYKENIAPPYEVKGFVAGARLAAQLPGFLFLPSAAVEVRGTYDFEIKRAGFEVPFYFVTSPDGKPTGGIQFSCTTTGRARGDVKFDGDCSAAIFVGTEFKLDAR